jgi:hypothetical protein
MDLIAIHRSHHYSGHSTTPPHRPSPSPSPYKRAPPPRGIPHLSHPSPALLPFSPLTSIGASTAAALHAVVSSPPAFQCLTDVTTGFAIPPTPPWLLTASFSAPKRHIGQSPVTPPSCSPAVLPTTVVAPASFFPICRIQHRWPRLEDVKGYAPRSTMDPWTCPIPRSMD